MSRWKYSTLHHPLAHLYILKSELELQVVSYQYRCVKDLVGVLRLIPSMLWKIIHSTTIV